MDIFIEKHLDKFSYRVLQTPSWKRQVIRMLGMENGNFEANGENKREELIRESSNIRRKLIKVWLLKDVWQFEEKVHTTYEFGLRSLDKWWLHMIL